jgi:hypothetical protein
MNEKNWRDLFIPNTPKLMRMLEVIEKNIEAKINDLYIFFQEIEVCNKLMKFFIFLVY